MERTIRKNELITEIILEASAEKIWNVLVDLETWSAWNPFIVQASGEVKVGSTLTNTMMNNGKRMVIRPKVTHVDPFKKLAWSGSALAGGFKGFHFFILEEIEPEKVKLIHGERFWGWLIWLLLPMVRDQTLQGFIRMNKALKTRLQS